MRERLVSHSAHENGHSQRSQVACDLASGWPVLFGLTCLGLSVDVRWRPLVSVAVVTQLLTDNGARWWWPRTQDTSHGPVWRRLMSYGGSQDVYSATLRGGFRRIERLDFMTVHFQKWRMPSSDSMCESLRLSTAAFGR
jgi:hypothetical protein